MLPTSGLASDRLCAVVTPRERRLTVAENDVRVLDAAVTVLAQFGLDGMNARRVAEAAGLSTGAIYGRFENIDELMIEVWQRRVRPVLRAGLARAVAFSDPADGVVPEAVPEEYDEVLERIGGLLIALAPRSEVLGEVIVPEVSEWLVQLGLGPSEPMPKRADRAVAVATYLGAMLYASVSDAMSPNWELCLGWWAQAQSLSTPVLPMIRPRVTPPELSIETGDEDLDRLLVATAEVIARAGVAGTTLTRIARRATMPRSAVYSHFDSRDELVQACVYYTTVNSAFNARRLAAVRTVDGLAEMLMQGVSDSSQVWRRQRVESLLAAISDTRLASSVLRAGLEAEAEVVRNAAPATLEAEYALRQLLRFYDVIITGACLIPEICDVLADVDWRPAASPLNRAAMASILGPVAGDEGSSQQSAG